VRRWTQPIVPGESGLMTRDPAVLISPDQKWLNTQDFLAKLDESLKKEMA
jgi:isocitrate dehydrogenase